MLRVLTVGRESNLDDLSLWIAIERVLTSYLNHPDCQFLWLAIYESFSKPMG